MKTAVSTKGRIVLPAEIRRQDRIEPGQELEVERIDRGAPNPEEILSLAVASFADIPAAELDLLTRRLREPESWRMEHEPAVLDGSR